MRAGDCGARGAWRAAIVRDVNALLHALFRCAASADTPACQLAHEPLVRDAKLPSVLACSLGFAYAVACGSRHHRVRALFATWQ